MWTSNRISEFSFFKNQNEVICPNRNFFFLRYIHKILFTSIMVWFFWWIRCCMRQEQLLSSWLFSFATKIEKIRLLRLARALFMTEWIFDTSKVVRYGNLGKFLTCKNNYDIFFNITNSYFTNYYTIVKIWSDLRYFEIRIV